MFQKSLWDISVPRHTGEIAALERGKSLGYLSPAVARTLHKQNLKSLDSQQWLSAKHSVQSRGECLTGVSNLRPAGPRAAQGGCECGPTRNVNLLKTLWDLLVITCCNVFNVWPKTTLLPLWCRDTKRLDSLRGRRSVFLVITLWADTNLASFRPKHTHTHTYTCTHIIYVHVFFLCTLLGCTSHLWSRSFL